MMTFFYASKFATLETSFANNSKTKCKFDRKYKKNCFRGKELNSAVKKENRDLGTPPPLMQL